MKNEGVGKETIRQLLSGIMAIGGYLKFEMCNFLVKLLISVSACYSFINRYCLDKLAKRCEFYPIGLPSQQCWTEAELLCSSRPP
jgi:hypothetical protein